MTNIILNVNGATAVAKVDGLLTSGMVGVTLSVTYDDSWSGLKKTACFKVGSFTRSRENIGTSTTVPWEVLRNHGKTLEVGIEGKDSDGNIVIPTTWAIVSKILPGANADIPGASNPEHVDVPTGNGAVIDDSQISTNTTWSSDKISKEIDKKSSSNVPEGAVLYTEQALTTHQQQQARNNIGAIGNGDKPWLACVEISDQEQEYGVAGATILPEKFELLPDDTHSAVLSFYGAERPDGNVDEKTILRNISTPIRTDDAANKGYVDGIAGDIETALDGILAIQNALIGGEEA